MWTYQITTGHISHGGKKVGAGYSGFGDAANDPTKVALRQRGPLPTGKYRIGTAYKHDKLGPVCMNLDPLPGTEMHGRSAFRIHGDNSTPTPYDGSHGCIILPREIRERVNFSDDKLLEVIE